MKKLILIVLMFFLSTNSIFAYTFKEGDAVDIERHIDDRVRKANGRPIFLDSTTFHPKGFLDGTIIQGSSNQPFGAGRTFWNADIDGQKLNCNTDANKMNKKCFIRHSGLFTKIDVSRNNSIGGGSTNYPSMNNVITAEVDARYSGDFEFGLAGFGVSKITGLAQTAQTVGGVVRNPDYFNGGEYWAYSNDYEGNIGAAIMAFPLNENGEPAGGLGEQGFEIYDENNQPLTEKLGYRNVVTSFNKNLFRGKCLSDNASQGFESDKDAQDPSCKNAWNLIFGLTPKMVIQNSDVARGFNDKRVLQGTEVPTYKIGFRIMPIVRLGDGRLVEPSYVADDAMGKAAFGKTRNEGVGSHVHELLDQNNRPIGSVPEISNYVAFATNSVLKDDGLYVPKFNFNQVMSAFKRLGNNGDGDTAHPILSEFLNYSGNFITFQPRVPATYKKMTPVQEIKDNQPVSVTSLGCLVYGDKDAGCKDIGVISKQHQVDGTFMRAQLKKGTEQLSFMTVDMDNTHSAFSNPAVKTTFGFLNVGSLSEILKLRQEKDQTKAELLSQEMFEEWKKTGITTTFAYGDGATRTKQDIAVGNSGIARFLGTTAAVTQYNESLTNKNGVLDEGRTSYAHKLDHNTIPFSSKNFDYTDGQPFSSAFRVDAEGNENEMNDSYKNDDYHHGQGAISDITSGGVTRKGYSKTGLGLTSIPVSKLILNKAEREKYLECTGEGENERCKLKEDYTIYFYISGHNSRNAFAFAMSADMFKGPPNEPDLERVPIDLGLKMNQLCTFRKAVADTDPSQAYYKLLNADKSCKDIVVKHLFSATQDQGTDAFNQAWTIKEEPLENPTEPLQPGQRATMEVNHTNVCDLAFVGKVIASNTDILQRDIKDLKLRISSIPKNVEMLDAADINVGDKSVKFKSKPKGSDMNVENPILNTLGLLPGEDTKKVQGDFIIQACNGDIYRTPLNGDSDEQELYLKLEADSNAWAKSKGSKVCQYAFEYAFRPLAPQCSAIDTNTYGTDDSGEITVGKVKNGEPTTFKYPEDGSNRVVKDYEGFTSKSGEMAKYLTFTDMRIGNFGFSVSKLQVKKENKEKPEESKFVDATPLGKTVVYGGIGINVKKTPSLEVRIAPPGRTPFKECSDGGDCPDFPELNECIHPAGSTPEKRVGNCFVQVHVCMKNVDSNKRTLYNARIDKVFGGRFNFLNGGGEFSDTNVIWNDMGLNEATFGTLAPDQEKCTTTPVTLEVNAPKNINTKPNVQFYGTAKYNNITDFGGQTTVDGKTKRVGWKITGRTNDNSCVEIPGFGEVCFPKQPPICLERGTEGGITYSEKHDASFTRFVKNTTKDKFIKNYTIRLELDRNAYVTNPGKFVHKGNNVYELHILSVGPESTSEIAELRYTSVVGTPSGTKMLHKETHIFEDEQGTRHQPIIEREVIHGNGEGFASCEPTNDRDFVTVEIPKTPIGEIPQIPGVPPTPEENPNIPFNEIPSKDVPPDGGKVKNGPPPTTGDTPGALRCVGNYCVISPGKNNDGEDLNTIGDVCSIYNPTSKDGADGSKAGYNASTETPLPKDLPITRTVKANYYRVEHDEVAKNNVSRRLNWKVGATPQWANFLQVSSDDYTNGPRDLKDQEMRVVYQNNFIDWTIELPCELRLTAEHFGSNDPGDARGTTQLLSKRTIPKTLKDGNTCQEKEYVVRQFIKSKGDDYKNQYYEFDTKETFFDEVQKRVEGVSYPVSNEIRNNYVWRYITFSIAPDTTNGRQKLDAVKQATQYDKYIKVQGKLGSTRVVRHVVDEARLMPGKTNSEGYNCSGRPRNGWRDESRTYYTLTGSYCGSRSSTPLNYHRDTIKEQAPYGVQALGKNSTYFGVNGGSGIKYNKTNLDPHVSYHSEGFKAMTLPDICNPGAALCVLGGDIYSQGKVNMEKAIFDYRKPSEFSIYSGEGVTKTKRTNGNESIYEERVSLAFEDPTGTIVDKMKNPQNYCDYIDASGKPNPATGLNCKTTYFEDLKTGKRGGVKPLSQQKWISDINLSDPENPVNNTPIGDYKKGHRDVVWHVKGDLIIGNNPVNWITARGKGTIFVEGDLYINSNMQYGTNGFDKPENAWMMDSIMFVTSGNIYVAPEVQSTVGVFAAMGPNSQFFSCGKNTNGECGSRTPLLIQKLVARKINFDRKASNVPLIVKNVKMELDTSVGPQCGAAGVNNLKNPECFKDICKDVIEGDETRPECFTKIDQLSSAECIVDSPRDLINPPSGMLEKAKGIDFKRIEIAPGENHMGNILDRF